jgi:branched-chain amino acid transport system substrate-binding protein
MSRKCLLTISSIACIVAAIAILLPGCSQGNSVTNNTTPIKIGAIIPLTGATSDTGKIMQEACQLAIDQVGGKVAGRPVQLVVSDTANDQNTALDKARQMVQVQNVQVFVLDPMQAISGAVSSYLETVPALGLNTVATPIPPTKLSWTLFGGGEGYQYSYELGIYCAKVLGWKTCTTIGSDFVSGHGYVGDFQDAFTKNGGTIVQQQWSPPFIQDYGPYLTGMKKADGVMSAIVIPVDAMAFQKQYAQFGVKMPVAMTVAGALSDKYLDQLGDAAIGMYGSTPYTSQLTNKQNKDFIAAYTAKYKETPEYEAASTYAVMEMLLAALEKTKGDTTPATLRTAMLGSKVETAVGPLSFSPEGATYCNVYEVKVAKVNGHYVWQQTDTTYTNVPPKGH